MAIEAVFRKKTQESDNIYTFYFEPIHPVDFIPGQFTELFIPHGNPDDRGTKRWFTISSAPFDKLLSVTTKINPQGSSFKKSLSNLKSGDKIKLAEPMGDFVLPLDPSTPLLFVAAGVGVTPFHSMALWLINQNEHRNIKLMHAISTEDDIIFQDIFNKAGIHSTFVVSNPSDSWGGERGHITADHILKITEPDKNTLIYISGPEKLVETLQSDLSTLGIEKNRLLTDFFHNYESL